MKVSFNVSLMLKFLRIFVAKYDCQSKMRYTEVCYDFSVWLRYLNWCRSLKLRYSIRHEENNRTLTPCNVNICARRDRRLVHVSDTHKQNTCISVLLFFVIVVINDHVYSAVSFFQAAAFFEYVAVVYFVAFLGIFFIL